MSSKQRIIMGIIFILGGIAVCIPAFLGMHENPKMSIAFLCITISFIWIGIGQIVFSYIIKSKVKPSINKE